MSARSRRRAAALLAIVVAASVGGGCGGESDRERVEHYLEEANAIQTRSAPAFRRANALYRRFSSGDLARSSAPRELARAERSIRSARAELARLRAPREAARLHRRLLHVYHLNEGLARETTQLARYLPAAATALRPLTALNRRLRRELGASAGAEAQGKALGRYADELDEVVTRLRRLRPPPVLAASDRARTRRLALTGSLASRLRTAIEERRPKRVARLLLRFRRVTAAARSDAAFAARSLRAYNRRYRRVSRAAGAVQQERLRVERSL